MTLYETSYAQTSVKIIHNKITDQIPALSQLHTVSL